MKDNKKSYYGILTLDGNEMLKPDRYYVIQDENNNHYCMFDYDFSEKSSDYQKIVKSKENYGDCALFYQLDKLIMKEEGFLDTSAYKDNYNQILFIDFKEFVDKYGREIKDANTKKVKRLSKSQWSEENNIGWRFRCLLSGRGNISITFEDGKKYHYYPFDKSNSMARASKISLIREDFKEKLDESLRLGIDFSKIQVVLSKYYSYRGLYMSTGYRVGLNCFPEISDETVIVLKDSSDHINRKVITANGNSDDENAYWEYEEIEKDININCFDGEGIISPEFARCINEELNKTGNRQFNATSFQIRMPFTKGMLHAVDFQRFFREEFGIKQGESLFVKDIFGVKRDVTKAGIIMTKSMFKMANWLKKYYEGKESLIMKEYFDNLIRYDHALYITNSDEFLGNTGFVSLNYQFLSTLDLNSQGMKAIIDDYLKRADEIEEQFASQGKKILDSIMETEFNLDESVDSDDIDMTISREGSVWNKCQSAVYKNKAFLKEKKVRGIISGIRNNYFWNIAKGRLTVDGEQKFLSEDLLAFLVFIGDLAVKERKKEGKKEGKTDNNGFEKTELGNNVEDVKNQCIGKNSFYMVSANDHDFDNSETLPYGFLRNPHLSRNEQCVLFRKENSLYRKYFCHLKGIVMVPFGSLVPMALGGADFDGDIVKVIKDSKIVDAILSGVYKSGGNKLDRKLPIVDIPSRGSRSEYTPDVIPFGVIVNTFSNSIGRISNMAVEFATARYFGNALNDLSYDPCAACTIVTGLEIDAAKTGTHPKANLEELVKLKKQAGKGKYIDFKEKVYSKASLRRFFSFKMETIKINGRECFSIKCGKTKLGQNFPIYSWEDNISNIERLPYICAKELYKPKSVSRPELRKKCYFDFENNKGWKKDLNPNIREKVVLLVGAYNSVKKIERETMRIRQSGMNDNSWGILFNIIKTQYGSEKEKLSDKVRIEDALISTKSEIRDLLIKEYGRDNYNKEALTIVKDAIERLKENKWQLTSKDLRGYEVIRILGIDKDKKTMLTDIASDFIFEFRKNGYTLLYFILKSIEADIKENLNLDSDEEDVSTTGNVEHNPYFQGIYECFLNSDVNKEEKKITDNRIAIYCRKELEQIVGDMVCAIKYVWSVGGKSNFFWEVFNEKEIVSAIEGQAYDE